MAQNMCRAFSIIKSNILNTSCLKYSIRNFQSFQVTPRILNNCRYPNFITPKEEILKTKRTITLLPFRRSDQTDINTNVANNVVLFKYENSKYFTYLNILGIFQVFIFFGMAWLLQGLLPKRRGNEPTGAYLRRSILIVLMIGAPIFAGLLTPLIVYAFTVRSIKYIILNKGGQKVTIVTHHPIKNSVQITVPIEETSVKKSRKELNRYMSIKLDRKPFFYVVHRDGTFVNTELYDMTIGCKKSSQIKSEKK